MEAWRANTTGGGGLGGTEYGPPGRSLETAGLEPYGYEVCIIIYITDLKTTIYV